MDMITFMLIYLIMQHNSPLIPVISAQC